MKATLTCEYTIQCDEEDKKLYEEMLEDGAISDLLENFEEGDNNRYNLSFDHEVERKPDPPVSLDAIVCVGIIFAILLSPAAMILAANYA